ncbi:hypothetical protein AAFF_G00120250 [Aldrovandia affinis]|uniref:Uncharacterized protein n=1 Tax=Aldrovandia affinis TaxID=143900 RepID=A0AAD7WA28_9TELE|nr:hypothetical protein AAFF_G00120250 [Aldrovandia affinis]
MFRRCDCGDFPPCPRLGSPGGGVLRMCGQGFDRKPVRGVPAVSSGFRREIPQKALRLPSPSGCRLANGIRRPLFAARENDCTVATMLCVGGGGAGALWAQRLGCGGAEERQAAAACDRHTGKRAHCRGLDRHEYHRSRSADQRPALERPSSSRSRSTERPDSNYMRSMPSLPSGRSAPPSPALTRAHPHSGSVQTSPTSTPMSSRRGRQLPQVPSKGTLERKDGDQGTETCEGAMDVEERTRQMKLKMNKYKQGAGSDSRLEQRSGRDQQRGSDNLSTKSSDSDVSDVSAVSRTSSASRFSSTSYMSVQSERPRGNRKISRSQALQQKSQSREGEEEVLREVAEEGAGVGQKDEAREGGTGPGGEGEIQGVKAEQETEREDLELQRRFSENDVR